MSKWKRGKLENQHIKKSFSKIFMKTLSIFLDMEPRFSSRGRRSRSRSRERYSGRRSRSRSPRNSRNHGDLRLDQYYDEVSRRNRSPSPGLSSHLSRSASEFKFSDRRSYERDQYYDQYSSRSPQPSSSSILDRLDERDRMLFHQSQDSHARGVNPEGNYILVPLDCYVENGALLQFGLYEPLSNKSIVHTLMPDQGLTEATCTNEQRLRFSRMDGGEWFVYDPTDQNWTHLMSFHTAITKVMDHFGGMMRDHQLDGVLLLAHEEYNMHYFLKAVKKCGAYEKFCSTVKGIGTLEQYLTGMHTF